MPKLTLSVDQEVIEQARTLASRNRTSISAMFERLIRLMARGSKASRNVGPITRKLTGVIKVPRGKTYRQLVEDALIEKHRS